MNWFGLTPEQVAARITRAEHEAYIPTLKQSVLMGAFGFTCASWLVFATVAFAERWMYNNLGLAGAYTVWTLLFIMLGGGLLSPLVIGPERLLRFLPLFAVAFLLYAAGWTGAYFTLRGAAGEWVGSLVGSLLLALTLAAGFGAMSSFPRLFVVLLLANSAGYFLGEIFFFRIPGRTGMILWGLVYGLCLGAGLGWSLYLAQARLRARLQNELAHE